MSVWAIMNGCGWVDGLGWQCGIGSGLGWVGCVWCWDSVGRAVDISKQRFPLIPMQSPYNTRSSPPSPDRIRTARQTPLSPPSPIVQPNSTPAPTLLQPTRPDPLPYPQTLSRSKTHTTPFQPEPLPHLNPTHLPHHTHSTYYRTLITLTPPTPICPPRGKDSHQS